MCYWEELPTWNMDYIRDVRRARDAERFYKLERFAAKRWGATRDLRYSRRWLCVIDAIKRRKP